MSTALELRYGHLAAALQLARDRDQFTTVNYIDNDTRDGIATLGDIITGRELFEQPWVKGDLTAWALTIYRSTSNHLGLLWTEQRPSALEYRAVHYVRAMADFLGMGHVGFFVNQFPVWFKRRVDRRIAGDDVGSQWHEDQAVVETFIEVLREWCEGTRTSWVDDIDHAAIDLVDRRDAHA